ncbi:MAG: hypothetical protein ACD_71C00023G0003 [uncultured bacterium (gcode 4)]|uniref:Uncharacterized protein n=1 Tax=uncultured bacterium (gcode 4) TaxID=1234023 RepID=K1Z697_9BACT|nr:MAG: hypothetical protein ACD_71C00023G0003 [uncultured bacterium (gcode 4)]
MRFFDSKIWLNSSGGHIRKNMQFICWGTCPYPDIPSRVVDITSHLGPDTRSSDGSFEGGDSTIDFIKITYNFAEKCWWKWRSRLIFFSLEGLVCRIHHEVSDHERDWGYEGKARVEGCWGFHGIKIMN